MGERVGGWVWGKWGVAPMASTGNLRAQAAVERVPGVNQFGAIRGLRPHVRVASGVRDAVVDKALLREALEE